MKKTFGVNPFRSFRLFEGESVTLCPQKDLEGPLRLIPRVGNQSSHGRCYSPIHQYGDLLAQIPGIPGTELRQQSFDAVEHEVFMDDSNLPEALIRLVVLADGVDERAAKVVFTVKPFLQSWKNPIEAIPRAASGAVDLLNKFCAPSLSSLFKHDLNKALFRSEGFVKCCFRCGRCLNNGIYADGVDTIPPKQVCRRREQSVSGRERRTTHVLVRFQGRWIILHRAVLARQET